MTAAVEVVLVVLGVLVVAATFLSAVKTVVVPRGASTRLGRLVFLSLRRVFELRTVRQATYEDRDRTMALYAPLALVTLPLVWLMAVMAGFTLIFGGLGVDLVRDAFVAAGSSMLTLGFVQVETVPQQVAAFSAAAIGLTVLALLITYLPSFYAAFSRREQLVTFVEIYAGTPPTPEEMLRRFGLLGNMEQLTEQVWVPWTAGFVDIEETHTTLSAINFFRSPQPGRSWVSAAGCVLDAAALLSSSVDVARQPPAALCIRAGYLSLQRIADYFGIPYDPDPAPDDPISVTRDEWEEVVDRLEAAGVPMRADRDQAWRDFAGWRVNYDRVLVTLAAFTMAAPAPWSSDRPPLEPFRAKVVGGNPLRSVSRDIAAVFRNDRPGPPGGGRAAARSDQGTS